MLAEPPRTTTDTPRSEFTPNERTYIRSELDQFFSTFPTVADGIQLRTWRTGERKGQPKLPPAAQSLLARDIQRQMKEALPDIIARGTADSVTAARQRRCTLREPTRLDNRF